MPYGGKVDPSRFAMIPRSDVPRSGFDVHFTHKTTFGSGYLIPVYVDEILPGDSLRLRMTGLARLATPITPVMDNIYLDSFFFYVPNRLLWANWQRFMGEQNALTDTTAFLVPNVTITDAMAGVGSLANYFGIVKPAAGQTYDVSALPFRAFNLIYNQWFRDEDLMAFAPFQTGDGPDNMADYAPRYRAKRHDYFTTTRPWPQKPSQSSLATTFNAALYQPGGEFSPRSAWNPGDPWGAAAPVSGIGLTSLAATTGPASLYETGGREVSYAKYFTDSAHDIRIRAGGGDYPDVRVLINDLRQANQLQRFMEQNARGGSRYTEIIRSHFGVISPDARLDRPEYLGGGRSIVNISPVAQTSATSGTDVLGELAGIGTAVARDHGFSSSFTEHGWVIGIVQVRADLSYQAGVNRMWFRKTVYDHYWPATANLGEQAVLSREIYADGSSGDETIFGYQERWSEYKWKPSIVTGAFSSYYATPLDMWHLAQKFTSRPTLNEVFVSDTPPFARVLQVATTASQEVLFDSVFHARWARAMPMHSIPGLGDRF